MLWPTQVQSESASAACARARPLLTGVPAWWLVLLAMAGSLAQVGKLGKQGFCNALNFQGRLLGSLLPGGKYFPCLVLLSLAVSPGGQGSAARAPPRPSTCRRHKQRLQGPSVWRRQPARRCCPPVALGAAACDWRAWRRPGSSLRRRRPTCSRAKATAAAPAWHTGAAAPAAAAAGWAARRGLGALGRWARKGRQRCMAARRPALTFARVYPAPSWTA